MPFKEVLLLSFSHVGIVYIKNRQAVVVFDDVRMLVCLLFLLPYLSSFITLL